MNSSYGVVYHVTHPDEPTRVRYVGKTRGTVRRREQGHWSDTNRPRRNSRFQNWLIKHRGERGKILFTPVIECDSPDELNQAEIEEISRLREIGQADLNITSGGDGGLGLPWTDTAKAKLSATLSGSGSWKAQFSWEEVRQIRSRYLAGATRRALVADHPRVTASTMQKILRNHTWKDPNYFPPGDEERRKRRDFVANSRLTPELVREIRDRATREVKMFKEWGEEYGVSLATARNVLAGAIFPDPGFDPQTVLRARKPRIPRR